MDTTTHQTASCVREELPPTLLKAVDLARVPGSSSWLTSLPIEEHGFCLHKGAFVGQVEKQDMGKPGCGNGNGPESGPLDRKCDRK